MTLNLQASYPQTHVYVVKLHRDSQPGKGSIAGRLEHVASGRVLSFGSTEELIACLARDIALVIAATPQSGS
jgi:hypothetical protein